MSEIMKKFDVKKDAYNVESYDIGADAGNIDFASGKNLEQKMTEVDETLAVKADLVDGRIPYSQLPESAMELKGTWNASTNTPHIENGVGDNGDFYIVSTAGTWNNIEFNINDRVIYVGTESAWMRLSGGEVLSVNGRVGAITLTKEDVGITAIKGSYIDKDATTYTVSNAALKVDSIVDIYYADAYDIEPSYNLSAGKLVIILEEPAPEKIYFDLKVVN